MAAGICAAPDCSNTLPEGQRKWCHERCRARIARRKERRQRREREGIASHPRMDQKPIEKHLPDFLSREESVDGRASARRGPGYVEFCRTDWPEEILKGHARPSEASAALGESGANVSRWMAAYVEDKQRGAVAANHTPDLAEDLGEFTKRYFPDLLVPGFHLEWESDIDSVVGTGGRLLLLAPQRFGKSEMLIRYCMKRIGEDPNISIGWVSKTADLAERMVGYVRQNLEHNEAFINDTLGIGGTFVPPNRSGLSWTNGAFTIATRTKVRKSPTMEAIGVGGTIVGRDFDLIILDDPQDRTRCMSPSQRDKDAEWMFTDFLSRKEEHTGVAFIMSRQHMEDLPGKIIKEHLDQWEVKVYRAHDPVCTEPERDLDAHHDCLLWPEFRTWKWLYPQKLQNEAHFQRNYMNDPKTDATTYITADEIDTIKDHTRRAGEAPSGSRLIAGIDPAEAKPVAAVLWGYDGIHRHVVDCGEFSASVVGLRTILSTWPDKYGVREFAFEKNMAGSWMIDEEVRRLVREKRLTVHQFYTSRINKHSNAIGPIAMFQRMRSDPPTITLPWASGEGRERIERLVRSWLAFDPEWAGHKHADDDLTMASWFPQETMDSWEAPAVSEMQVDYDAFPDPMRGY